jgi:hypothetical protein
LDNLFLVYTLWSFLDSFYIVLLLPSISKVKKYLDLKNVSVEKIPLAASEVIEVKKSKDIHFFSSIFASCYNNSLPFDFGFNENSSLNVL